MNPPSKRRLPPLRVAVFLVATLVVSVTLISQGSLRAEKVRQWVERAGSSAKLFYVILVVLFQLAWMPRALGLISGGLLFGAIWGSALSLLADLGAALLCFLMSRRIGRDWAQGVLWSKPMGARLLRLLVGERPLRIIALLRLCPVAHYTLVSYVAGTTHIPLLPYTLGTVIGILPAALLYPWLGDQMLRPTSPAFLVGLAGSASLLVWTVYRGRRLLSEDR